MGRMGLLRKWVIGITTKLLFFATFLANIFINFVIGYTKPCAAADVKTPQSSAAIRIYNGQDLGVDFSAMK